MTNERVTVIVPVYNVESYLPRCVDSILNQTHKNLEIILVDDGSPDNCGAICDAYAAKDSRIQVIHQQNGGLSAARNAGLDWMGENSQSSYVTFVDSDDWLHPQYVECLLWGMATGGVEVAMVGLTRVYDDKGDFPCYCSLPEPKVFDGEGLFLADRNDFNYACGKLYRREHFLTLRYPNGKNFEDVFTTYRILFACNAIALVDIPLYYYFQNREGISHSPWKPGELVIFQGMVQQMDYYREHHFDRAYAKEEWLYVNHFAYELKRIRSNRADWKRNRLHWRTLRRRMLDYMKSSGGKFTFRTMPQCRDAAWPGIAGAAALVKRCRDVWQRYGLVGILKKLWRKGKD